MTFQLLIGLLILVSPAHAKTQSQVNPYIAASRRAEVWVADGQAGLQLQKKLPAGARVFVAQPPFFIIEFSQRVRSDDLQKLRQLPGVIQVQRPSLVFREEQDKPECLTGFRPVSAETRFFEQIGHQVQEVCPLFETCSETGRTKLWAQLRVAADLMGEELNRMGIRESVKVAVVDSGFDTRGRASFMTEKLKTERGHQYAADPNIDRVGHGTAVSSLIGGKGGVGIVQSPELTIYKETEPDGERKNFLGYAPSASDLLKASIIRACTEGNEIVNLSYGSSIDERGVIRDEDSDPSLLKYLGETGCLVVKAAGNSGVKKNFDRNSLDDAYLRVGATSPTGDAEFSSTGEVSAPGAGVYTFWSSQSDNQKNSEFNRNRCGEQGGFVNGTSFASPISTAVATDTLRVLKSSRAFKKMKPQDRIALLNRILAASMFHGNLNGLRSILIAERWVKRPPSEMPSPEELRNSLRAFPHPVCDEKPPECFNRNPCESGFRACVERARKRLLLCDAGEAESTDLIRTLARSGSIETLAEWIPAMKSMSPSSLTTLDRDLGEFWKDFETNRQDLTAKLDFLRFYSETTGRKKTEVNQSLRAQALDELKKAGFSEQMKLLHKLYESGVVDVDFLRACAALSPEHPYSVLTFLRTDNWEKPRILGIESLLRELFKRAASDLNLLSSWGVSIASIQLPESERLKLYEELFAHPRFKAIDFDIMYSFGLAKGIRKAPIALAYISRLKGAGHAQSWDVLFETAASNQLTEEERIRVQGALIRESHRSHPRPYEIVREKSPEFPRIKLLTEILDSDATDRSTRESVAACILKLPELERATMIDLLLSHPKSDRRTAGILARKACNTEGNEGKEKDCTAILRKVVGSNGFNSDNLVQLSYAVQGRNVDLSFAADRFRAFLNDTNLPPTNARYLAKLIRYFETSSEGRSRALSQLTKRFSRNPEVLSGIIEAIGDPKAQFSNTDEIISTVVGAVSADLKGVLSPELFDAMVRNPAAFREPVQILDHLSTMRLFNERWKLGLLFSAVLRAQTSDAERLRLIRKGIDQDPERKQEAHLALARSLIDHGQSFSRREESFEKAVEEAKPQPSERAQLMKRLVENHEPALQELKGRYLTSSIEKIFRSKESKPEDLITVAEIVISDPLLEDWVTWTYTPLFKSEIPETWGLGRTVIQKVRERKFPPKHEKAILSLILRSPAKNFETLEWLAELIEDKNVPLDVRRQVRRDLLESPDLGQTLRNKIEAQKAI